MSKVIEYSEDDDALDDDTLDDDALDVNFDNDSPLPSSLDVKIKKANLKKGKFKMKKIAADRSYRMLKEAGTEGRWIVAAALGVLPGGLALAGFYAINSSFRKVANDQHDTAAGLTSAWAAQMAKDWL